MPGTTAVSSTAQKLQPIPERVGNIEPSDAEKQVIDNHIDAGRGDPTGDLVEIGHFERRVGLLGRRERVLDSTMYLGSTMAEPGPTSRRESRRLLRLLETEHLDPECSCLVLAVARYRHLNVV